MNVGLPGTGIGGLFYLVTALLMPVFEMLQTLRGRSNLKRWRVVLAQSGLAASIIGGLWLTSRCLHRMVPMMPQRAISSASTHADKVLGVTPTALTIWMLVALLASVEMLRVLQVVKRMAIPERARVAPRA